MEDTTYSRKEGRYMLGFLGLFTSIVAFNMLAMVLALVAA